MSKKSVAEIVDWWESKRVYYNGFLIVSYFLTFRMKDSTLVELFDRVIEFNNIVLGIIFIASINLFYFLGSGFELTLRKYNLNIGKMNWIFFLGGCLIAIIQFETFRFNDILLRQ